MVVWLPGFLDLQIFKKFKKSKEKKKKATYLPMFSTCLSSDYGIFGALKLN